MSENTTPESDIRDEFQHLGQHLKEILNTAWESEERKKVQADIQNGLDDLSVAINNIFNDFKASEAGQKVIQEVDDFGERLRSGEVRDQAREGVLTALKKMNAELEKASERFSTTEE